MQRNKEKIRKFKTHFVKVKNCVQIMYIYNHRLDKEECEKQSQFTKTSNNILIVK